MSYIKSQLHRRRHLVDILSAGTRGANKGELQFAIINRKGWRDLDHRVSIPCEGFEPSRLLKIKIHLLYLNNTSPIFALQKMGEDAEGRRGSSLKHQRIDLIHHGR